ncbi:MAG TPA: hypothetical protein PKM59_00095 [Thermodesulfobacteriota bacterium]|nr:hypothetical protein [Thermodesulfobacteriota bacterium]HNU71036.1 hypothetical protein [Thermodesulfobacteriota bacterium]
MEIRFVEKVRSSFRIVVDSRLRRVDNDLMLGTPSGMTGRGD